MAISIRALGSNRRRYVGELMRNGGVYLSVRARISLIEAGMVDGYCGDEAIRSKRPLCPKPEVSEAWERYLKGVRDNG